MSADIQLYHSGSGSNCDPDLDLGGAISSCVLEDGVETLFNSLTPKKSRLGLIDYRCFYIKNNGPDILHNTKIYIASEVPSGSFIDFGVAVINETQIILIEGDNEPLEGDYLTISIPNYGSFTVYYHPNLTEWQGRFLTEIRGIDGLGDTLVSIDGIVGYPTSVTFTIIFTGAAGGRDMEDMVIDVNAMTDCDITVDVIEHGSPVNTTACEIDNKLVKPVCVDFDYWLRGNPIMVGDLMPDEFLPLWVRRTTPGLSEDEPMTVKLTNDNFRINIDGVTP